MSSAWKMRMTCSKNLRVASRSRSVAQGKPSPVGPGGHRMTGTAMSTDRSFILGNMAQHAGHGKPVVWDRPGMKVISPPELNAWIDRPYRKGWQVG